MRVVDEAGAPIAGARVRAVAEYRICGPSGVPEGCGASGDESPAVVTDASGTAVVCDVAAAANRRAQATRAQPQQAARGGSILFGGHVVQPAPLQGYARGSIVVERAGWPSARVAFDQAATITLGPPRSLLVEVPAACSDMRHVYVSAYSTEGAAGIAAKALEGGLRTKRYQLDQLGPWRYWVTSRDARSGSGAPPPDTCSAFVRFVDARKPPASLLLDHSDAVIELPAFAGGRATVTAFRSDEVVATAALDLEGRATLALPTSAGTSYCLRLERDGQCKITYARAGEIARPGLYDDREDSIAATCGRCPLAPATN